MRQLALAAVIALAVVHGLASLVAAYDSGVVVKVETWTAGTGHAYVGV